MKKYKYILLFLASILGMTSCEKHEIEYMRTQIDEGMAEVQLHYYVPITAVAGNNIYKVELGGQEYVNNGAAVISTYNASPSGNVGRFYSVKAGVTNIKLYKGSKLDLVYDKSITLGTGKQNVFVY